MQASAGESTNASFTVIYDSQCGPCRSLAGFMKKKEPSIRFLSRDEFLDKNPDATRQWNLGEANHEIWVITSKGCLLYGTEAWEHLVSEFQSLKSLNWLAQKSGLGKLPAKAFRVAGKGLRALCFRCRKNIRR